MSMDYKRIDIGPVPDEDLIHDVIDYVSILLRRKILRLKCEQAQPSSDADSSDDKIKTLESDIRKLQSVRDIMESES